MDIFEKNTLRNFRASSKLEGIILPEYTTQPPLDEVIDKHKVSKMSDNTAESSGDETTVSVKGTPDQLETLITDGALSSILAEVSAEYSETDNTTQVNALVTLSYSGQVSKDVVGDLLESALEHCREEGMLSDPEWLNDPSTEDLACDSVRCRIL